VGHFAEQFDHVAIVVDFEGVGQLVKALSRLFFQRDGVG
jgi:hypothetical protein